jgi:hypothetical protein
VKAVDNTNIDSAVINSKNQPREYIAHNHKANHYKQTTSNSARDVSSSDWQTLRQNIMDKKRLEELGYPSPAETQYSPYHRRPITASSGKSAKSNTAPTSSRNRLSETRESILLPAQHPLGGNVLSSKQIKPSVHRPYSSYKKYQNMDCTDQSNKREEFLGTYTQPYMTPREAEIKEHKNRRAAFIGGSFKTTFGKASQIPLRQEGVIRPSGKLIYSICITL